MAIRRINSTTCIIMLSLIFSVLLLVAGLICVYTGLDTVSDKLILRGGFLIVLSAPIGFKAVMRCIKSI